MADGYMRYMVMNVRLQSTRSLVQTRTLGLQIDVQNQKAVDNRPYPSPSCRINYIQTQTVCLPLVCRV